MQNCLRYIFFVICLTPKILFGQAANTVEFGKNRVQYHQKFNQWLQYDSENFITYWYGDARNVGQFAVQMAEYDFNSIQKILEHRIADKMEIIVYTDLTDFKQSNIGVEESFESSTGQTKIAGNKIFIYFDGNHQNLRKQIREGIAAVFINSILFGSNLQEMVQNAVMLNMPLWFKQGLIAYCGEEWNEDNDNQLRDIMLSKKYDSFYELAEKNPKLAGHSFWHYIAKNYGSSSVPNLIYLARINKSISSGFMYVIGTNYENILDSWWVDNTQRYTEEIEGMTTYDASKKLVKSFNKKLPLTRFELNSKKNMVAYTYNEIGKWKVVVEDLKTGNKTTILKRGYKNNLQSTDYNYPIIAWKPNGEELSVIYEQRDVIKFYNYNTTTKKEKFDKFSPEFQRVFDANYIDNHDMVISAATKGFSDLFIYKTKTTQNDRLTNDIYDDLAPSVVNINGKKGIVFLSNRTDNKLTTNKLDTILPINKMDVFYYNLETRPNYFVRVTNTPNLNEKSPVGIDSNWIAWLSEGNGIYNKQVGNYFETIVGYEKEAVYRDDKKIIYPIDSVLTKSDSFSLVYIDTIPIIERKFTHKNCSNLNRNIELTRFNPLNNQFADLALIDGKYQIFQSPLDTAIAIISKPTIFNTFKNKITKNEYKDGTKNTDNQPVEAKQEEIKTEIKTEEKIAEQKPQPKLDTAKIDIDSYQFQSEFDDNEAPATVIVKDSGKIQILDKSPVFRNDPSAITSEMVVKKVEPQNFVHEFKTGKIIPYQLKFRTDFVNTNLDNNPLFGGLNSYTGFPQGYGFQPLGILLKANFKDLLEDYEIEGGMRFPTSFNGSEFFIWYKDKKKRWDKTYAIYRKSLTNNTTDNSLIPQRNRVVQTLGYYNISYPLDVFTSIRASATMRFDKIASLSTDSVSLHSPTINEQRVGARLEYVFDNTIDVGLNLKHGTRYKIYSEFTKRMKVDFVDNFEFNFNDGYMGVVGLDFRHYVKLDKYSILAGRAAGAASFGTEKILYFLGGVDNWLFPKFNSDIPIPQNVNYAYQMQATSMRGFASNIRNGNNYALVNVELRSAVFRYLFPSTTSSFIRNFQIIGFFDAGTAWTGASPFSRENPLNTLIIKTSPSSPISIKVNYFREPIVMSYGAGIRTLFLGYFARLDYGWGIETRIKQKPVLNLAIGMDF